MTSNDDENVVHLNMKGNLYDTEKKFDGPVLVCSDCLNAVLSDVNEFFTKGEFMADRLTQIFRQSCRTEGHKCHEINGNPSDEVSLATIHELASPPKDFQVDSDVMGSLADMLVNLIVGSVKEEKDNGEGPEAEGK